MDGLILGDCLEEMSKIPSNSVGMILADLPFGVTNCKWDSRLPLPRLWNEFRRILQPLRAVVMFSSQPYTTGLINGNPSWFRYTLYWHKLAGANFASTGFQPLRTVEEILVFSDGGVTFKKNGRTMKYNPQKEPLEKPYTRGKISVKSESARLHSDKMDVKTYTHSTPKTLLEYSMRSEKRIHPTQKPLPLYEYLIRTYTDEGDLVLDPTAGVMTTALACSNTNRRYICIEKDEEYYNLGKKRMESNE